ncbi:MAG TPA: PPOX class F420-dependent oxidoreductase [Jatrophihabitantaceae bacterium]|nr:PPOX class F420-dependent oxidoreductase [Jatrophihabitantaceae bacterium]
MEIGAAREFLRTNHHAVIATTRKNGRTHLTPITVAVDADGRVIISSVGDTVKVRNLRRDPHATICVLNDGFFGDWVYLEGPAEIVDQPEALDLLDDYYRRAAGEHPNWAEYREAMIRDKRVLIRIDIERAGGALDG